MNINPAIDYSRDQPIEFVEQESAGLDFNVRRIWAAIYRNRLILIGAVALCLVASIVYLMLATPRYEARSLVKIEEQSSQILKSDSLEAPTGAFDAERFLQTQLDIIKSRSVALAVARDQRLIGNTAFLRQMNLPEVLATSSILTPRQAQEEQAIGILQAFMDVELPSDSRIATISFRSPDPLLAARIANSFAESYIRTDLQRKFDTSSYARQFLSQQLQDAKRQLEASERSVLRYASQARLIDASNGADGAGGASATPKSLTVARLVALNSAYADAVARRTQAEQRWRQASSGNVMALPEVLQNPSIGNLLQKRAELTAQYEDQREIRKAEFPTVRQTKAQIDELTRQLGTLSGNIRGSLQSQYLTAVRQEQALKGQIAGLEQATLGEQQRDVQLSILRRATDTNRSLYDSLLQRFRQLNAEAGIQPNNIQLVDRAQIPTSPVTPRLLLTLLLGLVSGLVIGTAGVFVMENLNDTIRSGDDLSGKLGLPLLGMVPVTKAGEISTELRDRKSAISEAYSSIRASLLMSSRSGLPRTLAFTSIQAGEGKTTSSFATATGLARIGRSVVIIDCDLRRPALHKAFELQNRRGMSDYLSGQAAIADVVQLSDYEGVSIISCGPIPPNPTELLSGSLLGEALAELATRFDVVIVDAPPILGLADAIIIGAQVDGTVMVIEAGRNYHGSMRSAVERLRKGGANLLGALLTKQNMRNLGYAYADKYQYSYGTNR